MNNLVLIAHNLRSSHNVGSILRTAECLGASKVYITGYSPYPAIDKTDHRLPHIASKVSRKINKTALGAEKLIDWEYNKDIDKVISSLQEDNYSIIALEQTSNSKNISEFNPPSKSALIVGREVEGIEQKVLDMCDEILEIPMRGKKESLNVAQAAAIGVYHFTHYHKTLN